MNFKNKTVLCVISHPDDETIGCGGFIHRLSENGIKVNVLLSLKSNGPRSLKNWDAYLNSFKKACKILGANPIIYENMFSEDLAEQNFWKLNSIVDEYIKESDVILTHCPLDVHQTHRIVSRSVEISTRPIRTHKTVIFFEVPSSTDQGYINNFQPNFYVTLEENNVKSKLNAMKCYKNEFDYGRCPEDLLLILKVRGRQIGKKYAECFK
ncbi:MAG TPA: hypothetical protein DEP28_03140, partial [Bacteroidetes bacterium]|nr:hypothetical protein [Bacteroidota bacterium]